MYSLLPLLPLHGAHTYAWRETMHGCVPMNSRKHAGARAKLAYVIVVVLAACTRLPAIDPGLQPYS